MSTKIGIKMIDINGEHSYVYQEIFEDDKIYLQLEGINFEASNEGRGKVTVELSSEHALKLGIISKKDSQSE